jgi:acyl-CoA synthetase (AMP-forming)/AMP-acid ligase II
VADRYRLENGHAEPLADDEGWFHTGDLGRLDDQGYLYVDGRVKSTIVLASGKNVQPEEVEACLRERPEVSDVGVTGLGSTRQGNGEEVCAIVVPSLAFTDNCRSAGEDAEQALRCMVTEAACTLAPHKRPKRIVVRHQALPRTAAGKLKRSALPELAADGGGSRP